jgi:hypothetical protein
MNKRMFCLVALMILSSQLSAQTDEETIRAIYDEELVHSDAYENLRELCKDVGPRLSGSKGAEKAVIWSEQKMKSYGFDRVWTQATSVPKWVRGNPEHCVLVNTNDTLDVLALGFSTATEGRITGEVVMFNTLQSLQNAPEGSLNGKIAFLNQAMNPKLIDTFNAYGGCAGGRVVGASAAAEKGAIAFVMRSLGLRADDFPHTGVMFYDKAQDSIPAFALSTNSAFRLSHALNQDRIVELELESHCKRFPDVMSSNVIAELTGSEFPNEYIVVGGHLDSWDVGEGAHDDGAGVVQALEVIRVFKALGIRPKRTIRCVFFMNEENGARGAKTYAAWVKENNETHLAAMESDRGGFTPRGFTIDGSSADVEYVAEWLPLFEPYLINFIREGYGGVDINPLKEQGTTLIGFVPDSQRYFDVHHTANDVFENVNARELELGAATMTSLIYLIDKYGLPVEIND